MTSRAHPSRRRRVIESEGVGDDISGTVRRPPDVRQPEINTIIRLRDGETNMLAGLFDDERQSLEGSRVDRSALVPAVRALAEDDNQTTSSDAHADIIRCSI